MGWGCGVEKGREFGVCLGCGGKIFREVKRKRGGVFGEAKWGGSVERGGWLGCGGKIFREVKRKRGGVLGKRAEGGSVERGRKCGERRVLGYGGVFREVKRKRGGVSGSAREGYFCCSEFKFVVCLA